MKKKIKIRNDEILKLLGKSALKFPKYSTQILNIANQNAQGTRPKVVGQMSDLIQEFGGRTIEEWEKWYKKKKPNAIKNATDKIYKQIKKLKKVTKNIDKSLVKEWVEDLVITKTFIGLKLQEAILKKVAKLLNKKYRLATPEEEGKGIDGYIGDKPVSIKPITYKIKRELPEKIEVLLIFYEKKKDGIYIEFDF